jgi:paraquat-inducible protein B
VTIQEADTDQGGRISAIWIIPLLALALGAYMVVHTWMTEGPDINITFKTAEGLVAGKTKVKYRDVDMGLVEEVTLSDDLEKVVAKVKLERQALPMLREDTRFWVVTARIGMGQVTGLGTLLSGAYIEIAPGMGAEGRRDFQALERPPLTPADAPGLRLHLFSDRTTSVSAGDKVLFNGYQVGRVESRDFDPEKRKISYVIFIDAPFHKLVHGATRFWDVSGITLSLSAEGLSLQTGSVDTILAGGVAFGTPPGIEPGDEVQSETEFQLYESFDRILENPFKHGIHYVLLFEQSIKGLLSGAPVEFRGIPLGHVVRIMVKESVDSNLAAKREGKGDPIPVLIYLEPGRMELPDTPESVDFMKRAIVEGVSNGMRASLESGNLLTGAKYITVDYFPGAGPGETSEFFDYPTIPTVASGLGQLQYQLSAILDKVNALPLEATVANANAALGNLNDNLVSLEKILAAGSTQQLPADLQATLEEIRLAVSGLAPDSELYQNLGSSLLRLNNSLGNLETLTRTLASQPNAAIMPSSDTPDPIPEVTR